ALAIYTGELLPDDLYEEWAVQRRDSLRQVYLNLLLDLARLQETGEDYAGGIETLQGLLAADRSHEEAHTGLMRLYALSGQRQQALRQYQILCDVLKAELDTIPSPRVGLLYADIQSGHFPPISIHFQRRLQAGDRSPTQSSKGICPNNLPGMLTSFIGREKETDDILGLLETHRLVTLNGSGGTGKTRLALRVAAEITRHFPDGAWLVELAPVTDPETILPTIAAVLGLQESKSREQRTLLLNYLREKHTLLLMDNCEHLLDACARLVNDLLKACPNLTLLVTSREGLGITGEIAYRVPSLAVPDPNDVPPVEKFAQYDAVRLFIERARAVIPAFQLSVDNLADIARICSRLDGIPLAIELAAARVGVLNVEQIAARLDDRFRLLTGGSRTALPRQRTLRASMDWSYSLLSEKERVLFLRISVFNGGCSLESTEGVCAFEGLEKGEILESLSSLVDKSLVVADHQPRGASRYHLLETIRQYAQEKLAESNDAFNIRERHLTYFVNLAEEMEPRLKTANAPELLDLLDLELENVRAALAWGLSKNNQEGFAQELRLFNGLWRYWSIRGLNGEGIQWGARGLERYITEDFHSLDIRARACFKMGIFLMQYAIDQRGWKLYIEESVALFRKAGDHNGLALGLAFYRWSLFTWQRLLSTGSSIGSGAAQALADDCLALVAEISKTGTAETTWIKARVLLWIAEYDSDGGLYPEEQIPLIQNAYALFQELGDKAGEIRGAVALGEIALRNGDGQTARSYFLRALELARILKSKPDLEDVIGGLGVAAYHLQDYGEMENCFQQVQQLAAEITGEFHNLWPLRMQGKAVLHLGDYPRAQALFIENLSHAQKLNDTYGVLSNLLGLAGVAAHSSSPEKAVRLLAFFEAQMRNFFKPADRDDQIELKWHLDQVRQHIDPPAFSVLWEQGQEMTLEKAIAEAIQQV
ncbi:MAG: AAA family ATPase, partial [Anaerolineaceae bacterium]|nr:AAA family ATPase [Anaerolineaceae bacterium]